MSEVLPELRCGRKRSVGRWGELERGGLVVSDCRKRSLVLSKRFRETNEIEMTAGKYPTTTGS